MFESQFPRFQSTGSGPEVQVRIVINFGAENCWKELHRKDNFGPESYFESGPKMPFLTI